MTNFRDQVNANFKKEDSTAQIETKIKGLANNIANIFRKDILRYAESHKANDPEPFSYEGILLFNTPSVFLTRTGYTEKAILIWKKESTYGLNQYANVFLETLRRDLRKDEISVSDWKIASISGIHLDYFGESWNEKLARYYWRGMYPSTEFTNKPEQLTGILKKVEKQDSRRLWQSTWYHNGKKLGGETRDETYLCLTVAFE